MARKYAVEVVCRLLRTPDVTPQAMREWMGPSQFSTARNLAFFLRDNGIVSVKKVRGERREEEYRVNLTPLGERIAIGLEPLAAIMTAESPAGKD